ncbi:hypothetical protein CJU89_6986 [Yarrowia sp. B02]|nr:hypothetical protein CJU89_6986 [Yarrowia sp. B02]
MDLLNTFHDYPKASQDLLTPEDHHHLSHLDTWGSPSYSYSASTPEDSPGIYDFELSADVSHVTPTLNALISPQRQSGFYQHGKVSQSAGSLTNPLTNHSRDYCAGFSTSRDFSRVHSVSAGDSGVTSLGHVQQHQNDVNSFSESHMTSETSPVGSHHVTDSSSELPPDHVTFQSANVFESKNPSSYSSFGSRSNSTGHIGLYSPISSSSVASSLVSNSPNTSLYSQTSYSSPSLTDYITFEYSKNRTKTQYKILSHIHTVNTGDLSAEFKKDNCIYPRAAVPKEEYQGNRHQYETECNHIGWSLAHLNPCIRKKRGVIQRAVDSWRNTNPNPKFRSRRVRKLSKKTQQAAQAAAQQQHQQLLQQQRMMYVPYEYTYRQ